MENNADQNQESRQKDLDCFYDLMEQLKEITGGPIRLSECNSETVRPKQGVYFFFDDDEYRKDRKTPRIVRVGTHALEPGQKSTLWGRIRKHKGYRGKPGGNHRRSVFRKLVGFALMKDPKSGISKIAGWGKKCKKGEKISKDQRENEEPLEIHVSKYLGKRKVLWVEVKDEDEQEYRRGYIESNAIGLLSKATVSPNKPFNEDWLGNYGPKDINESGLWNSKHIGKKYDRGFLKNP